MTYFALFAAMLTTAVATGGALVMLPRVPDLQWRGGFAVALLLVVAAQVVLWTSVAQALLSGWRP